MDMRSEIKKLARIEEGPYPFFSVYLNTKWDDEQQRERIRLFTKNQLKKEGDRLKEKEAWRETFPEDQGRIERFVEGLVRRSHDEEVNGVALFACSGRDTFLIYPSVISFENEFFLSDLPVLRPLVRLSSQYQDTLAVMVETDSARMFEISLEGLVTEFSIEGYVPGRHDQGGWAQKRYQRHIKDHMDKHHKEVAHHLTELFDTGKWKRVILIGQSRTLANFKTFLPERVKLQVVDAFSMDFSEERSRVLERIFQHLLQKEKEEVILLIQELKENTPQGGRAAFGLNATLEALHHGQIQTLYLLTPLSLPGGKCQHCGRLVPNSFSDLTPSACPLCRGSVREIDLSEQMMRSVLCQDGEVNWTEGNSILEGHEGVAASLRFGSPHSPLTAGGEDVR